MHLMVNTIDNNYLCRMFNGSIFDFSDAMYKQIIINKWTPDFG